MACYNVGKVRVGAAMTILSGTRKSRGGTFMTANGSLWAERGNGGWWSRIRGSGGTSSSPTAYEEDEDNDDERKCENATRDARADDDPVSLACRSTVGRLGTLEAVKRQVRQSFLVGYKGDCTYTIPLNSTCVPPAVPAGLPFTITVMSCGSFSSPVRDHGAVTSHDVASAL